MPLIKAQHAPPSTSPFSMKDIENQAKAMLLRARQQADALLVAAQAEAEQLRRRAQSTGLTEGRVQGFNQGQEEGVRQGRTHAFDEQKKNLAQLAQALVRAATEVDAARCELEADALNDVLKLAIAIAERVTKRQGVLDPSVVISNVAEALKLVTHHSDLRIALHPDQKALLLEALPRLRLQWPQLGHVELIEDSMLAPGGCRIFTAHGEVDGDLDQQLKRIASELLPADQEVSP